MGRAPCCDKATVKKGPWSVKEDSKLKAYIEQHGTGGNWRTLPKKIGLERCGKSCRLRWLNYLSPNIKRGEFSEEEDDIICSLYATIGTRWSFIATHLPGRTDNDIKNHCKTKLQKKLLGKLNDQHNLHLAAVAEAKKTEMSYLERYILSEANLGQYGCETQATTQVGEHTNMTTNCPYVDFDSEIVSQLFEQANCSRSYTIADTSPNTQSSNFQQAFGDQMPQLYDDTSHTMPMIFQCIPWIEDDVELQCLAVSGEDQLAEIINSPLSPAVTCGFPDGEYESGRMNAFNAYNNMDWNEFLYLNNNGSCFIEPREGTHRN